MPVFITLKKYFILLFAAFAASALTALVLERILEGPRLGFYYDFLLNRRPETRLPGEILLIDTGSLTEPAAALSVLDALNEFKSGALVLEVPVLGFSPVRDGGAGEIRLNEEFSLIGRNIRSLFDAIRMGSVPPAEADRYVEELIGLTERGKERLNSALIDRDTSPERLEKAGAVFGTLFRTGDLRPLPDRDGVFRRISPIFPDGAEHPVYTALKGRWEDSALEFTEYGPVLINRDGKGEMVIHLDNKGAVLAGKPAVYRRLSLSVFQDYEEAGLALRKLLGEAEHAGIYSAVLPERSPLYLYDYAEALKEDMLEHPSEEVKEAWRAARQDFVLGLGELLAGPVETGLVLGYEELAGDMDGEGRARLGAMRDELIAVFGGLREAGGTFTDLRRNLEGNLESAFCIMGNGAEISARLAGALITGRHITPGRRIHTLFWAFLAAFAVVLAVSRLKTAAFFLAAPVLILLPGFAFSWYFIVSGCWIDPLIPPASAFAGALVFRTGSLAVRLRGAALFRRVYGTAAGKSWLRQLVKAGRPLPLERIRAKAAIMTIKDPALVSGEDQGDPAQAAAASGAFREEASAILKKAGAVILGFGRDTALACFGSPLERVCLDRIKWETPYTDDSETRMGNHPAAKAGGFVIELFRQRPGFPWRIGMDFGECLFCWSPLSGYTAFGRPVVRSRILAGLCPRYKARVLVSEQVREHVSVPVRKRSALAGSGEKSAFYELVIHSGSLFPGA